MDENSKPIALSDSIEESQINPKETISDIMVKRGRMGKPWLAPTVNGIRVDKDWTITFDCVSSDFKVEISGKDVVKVLKDEVANEHRKRMAELDLSPR